MSIQQTTSFFLIPLTFWRPLYKKIVSKELVTKPPTGSKGLNSEYLEEELATVKIMTPKCPLRRFMFILCIGVSEYLLHEDLIDKRRWRTLEPIGFKLSPGTVENGFRKIGLLLEPVYRALAEELRKDSLWNADETQLLTISRS